VRYLIDTDWTIHYLNGRPDIVQKVDELRVDGIALSVVSLAELYEGVYYSRDPRQSEEQLHAFLRGIAVLGVDLDTGKLFGRERGRLRSIGQLIGDFDLLIGTTALQHDLIVMTSNRRHFEMIDGLRLEVL
jgi:tRNA(fMet)-specific endonuclease VapC